MESIPVPRMGPMQCWQKPGGHSNVTDKYEGIFKYIYIHSIHMENMESTRRIDMESHLFMNKQLSSTEPGAKKNTAGGMQVAGTRHSRLFGYNDKGILQSARDRGEVHSAEKAMP